MRIGTVVGMPDLERPTLGLYQGPDLERSFAGAAEIGFDGAELMLKNPAKLNSREVTAAVGQTRPGTGRFVQWARLGRRPVGPDGA